MGYGETVTGDKMTRDECGEGKYEDVDKTLPRRQAEKTICSCRIPRAQVRIKFGLFINHNRSKIRGIVYG